MKNTQILINEGMRSWFRSFSTNYDIKEMLDPIQAEYLKRVAEAGFYLTDDFTIILESLKRLAAEYPDVEIRKEAIKLIIEFVQTTNTQLTSNRK